MINIRRTLAGSYGSTKNVRIHPVVIPELELIDIERKIFVAHFMKRSHDPALKDRPEAFNGVRVDCTDNILALAMVNNPVREVFVKRLIGAPYIGAEQTDASR